MLHKKRLPLQQSYTDKIFFSYWLFNNTRDLARTLEPVTPVPVIVPTTPGDPLYNNVYARIFTNDIPLILASSKPVPDLQMEIASRVVGVLTARKSVTVPGEMLEKIFPACL